MTTVGAYEAKTHFSQLLERVARGERIIVTRHGVPIAIMQPVEARSAAPPEQVIAAIKALRSNYHLDGLSIREMVEEGRA